jgi:hypothetical protein
MHAVGPMNLRMIKDIIDVPFPLAASRRLMSFLTFHISMFFSASVPLGALMAMFERPLEGLCRLTRGLSGYCARSKRVYVRTCVGVCVCA